MTLEVSLRHRLGDFALEVEFAAGEGVTALFGPSGSGKTSVIHAVAGLLTPQAGRIAVGGRVLLDRAAGVDVPAWRRRVACVFQEARLFPHLTVRQNLTYGRLFQPAGGVVSFAEVVEVLGIAALLGRRPAGLSGGERQRVAIGRALLSNPGLLLMDEPLAALDEARKAEILPLIETLARKAGVPVLYVSHSMTEVARLADRVVRIEAGRVLGVGGIEVFADPDAVTSEGLRAAGSVLRAVVVAHEVDGLTRLGTGAGPVWVPRLEAGGTEVPLGAEVRVRIAAQDVILSRGRPEGLSALNLLAGEIMAIRQGEGPSALVQVRLGEDLVLARVTQRSVAALGLAEGVAVHVVLKSVVVGAGDIGLSGVR